MLPLHCIIITILSESQHSLTSYSEKTITGGISYFVNNDYILGILVIFQVEDVWVVKRKDTKEPKGIAYVKFTKASEAALAMEKLHGSTIGDNPKPIKVHILD